MVTRTEAANAWVTRHLPILIVPSDRRGRPVGAGALPRGAGAAFERQLAYLRRHGYRAIALDEWLAAWRAATARIEDRVGR